MARINEKQRDLAMQMYAFGISPTKIGEMVGCSKSAVTGMARDAGLPLQHPEQSRRRQKQTVCEQLQLVEDLTQDEPEMLDDQAWRSEVLALLRRLVRAQEASA